MLFLISFIVLSCLILIINKFFVVNKSSSDISFGLNIVAVILFFFSLITGTLTLCEVLSKTNDLEKLEKLRDEINVLNNIEDKNSGIVLMLNEKVNSYNKFRMQKIHSTSKLMLNNEEYKNTPMLYYDLENNIVIER